MNFILLLKKFILVVFFLIFQSQAYAILNIEQLRRNNELGLNGGVEMTTAGEKGNSDKFTGNLSLMNAYLTEKQEYFLLTDYSYGESNEVTDTHKGKVHLRGSYLTYKKYYTEAFVQSEFDEFRSLDYRQLYGLGLRRIFFSSEDFRISSGLGAFYEFEKYGTSVNEERVRMNLYMAYFHKITDSATLDFTVYYQPDLSHFSDVRAVFSPRLKTMISEKLSFLAKANLLYDSKPIINVQEFDLSYSFGISLDY